MYKLTLATVLLFSIHCIAQEKKPATKREPLKNDLPGMKKCILDGQANAAIFAQNMKDHGLEHDVNSIILDIEKYIDSMPKTRSYADQMLMKYFNPLRHFFLTTTNKTSVATMFLYADRPYQFCMYNDSATALYFCALKDGEIYNLSKMTERRIVKSAFENCLLPSLMALNEFKDEPKYIALSVYYGCKDTREGAPPAQVSTYCLTFVGRTSDLQQYADGIITTKGLLTNGEIYLSDMESAGELRRIQISME